MNSESENPDAPPEDTPGAETERSGEPSSCGRASCAFFRGFVMRRRTMHDDNHDRQ